MDSTPTNKRSGASRSFVKVSPVDGTPLGTFPLATPQEVHEAVARARRAWPAWRDTPLADRLRLLQRLRDVLLEQGETYAAQISQDTGKPLVDAMMTEMISVPVFVDHYVRTARRVLGRRRVVTPLVLQPRTSYVEAFPMGVVAVISPWNFPFQLAVLPVISALIAGNTVVLKPSEVTPLVAGVVRDLFQRIRLPDGVLEVVYGDGEAGAALCDADVNKIFFTGSVATGRRVMAAAAQKPIPVELELGGKDAFLVCADANLERAARAAVWGALLNAGQACVSVERILVVDAVHDRFVELLQREVASIRMGGPTSNADVGPITSPAQLDVIAAHVADAVARGARVWSGGARAAGPGQFYPPTLLTGITPDMLIYREETFGPVLPVMRVADELEGVRLANAHDYGLTASVWTADTVRGLRLASAIEAGQVMVNDVLVSVGHPGLPFGGVKASGFGRYHGDEGLLAFCNQRAVLVASGRAPAEPYWFPYADKLDDMKQLFSSLLAGQLLRAGLAQRRLLKKSAGDTPRGRSKA